MASPVGGTTIMVAWLALAGFAARKAFVSAWRACRFVRRHLVA
ncbi:MAG: hypothetical protein AAFW82_04255 [Pseudomonadota bacterium]